MKLSEHFTLGEMCKTRVKADNTPNGEQVQNLKRLCGWLEQLRKNHLQGCAADIHCKDLEQAFRYSSLLLDISDITHEDFDELIIERSKLGNYWIHFAVRPMENRRRTNFKR